MISTNDPSVRAEEQLPGYARYRSLGGRRWEVFGQCVGTGHCAGDGSQKVDTTVVRTPETRPCDACKIEFRDLPPAASRTSWD